MLRDDFTGRAKQVNVELLRLLLDSRYVPVVAAIARQAERLISCPETFHNDVRAAYLERLVAVLPMGLDRVFLCNSGTEAVGAALKFA